MHMRGTPQTMQSLTTYDDIIKEMLYYFRKKVTRSLGINDLIIDPGFGFTKQ
jgi:dihydropteroate synthase